MSSNDYKAGYFADLARQVSLGLSRDNARKQRIIARSPHIFSAMDAGEYEGMSSMQMAKRELDALGIKPDERSVEEQLLDAHHAGRAYARQSVPGRRNPGTNSAQDSAEGSFVDHYINHE